MKRVLLVLASCAVVAVVAYRFGGERVRSVMNTASDVAMNAISAW